VPSLSFTAFYLRSIGRDNFQLASTHKVIVIGGGISGLACAFRLQQLGIRALLLEASGKAGGLVATVRRNGFLFEGGPQCPRFPAAVWTLVRELNLENEFVAGDPKAKRYILRDGRLQPAPFSPGALLATPLLSLRSKYRLLSEALRHSRPPADEESLAEFVERKFGAEVLDYLADPFVSTVFLGDANKMGMESAFPALVEWERSRGSVVRGAIRARKSKRDANASGGASPPPDPRANREALRVTDALPSLGSFKNGMGTLAEKLAEKLDEAIRFETKVESIQPLGHENSEAESGWRVRASGGQEFDAEAIVLALPAYAAASLLERSAPQLSALLAGIEHAPMSVVSSAYHRNQVSHPLDGFGFMVPRREGLRTICTFWNSSLFPDRAGPGQVLMTSFSREESGSPQTVEVENAQILGITGAPLDRAIWNYPRALPQYNIGHAQRVREIREALDQYSGIFLAGNYLTGRSIGDCVETGFQAVENLRSRIRN
jgi:protoporphyrinogen/coproporphyrinogen III oxidase